MDARVDESDDDLRGCEMNMALFMPFRVILVID